MLKATDLKPKFRKRKRRVGRGTSSGFGKTCGRGHKGQKSRAGGTKGARFEGGQTPIYRRLPKKRSFKNYPFRSEFAVINLVQLGKFEGEAGLPQFIAAGLASEGERVKILGKGEISKPLKVSSHKFSRSAKEKIEKAGGSAIEYS